MPSEQLLRGLFSFWGIWYDTATVIDSETKLPVREI